MPPFLYNITRLLQDQAPEFVFELNENGIAFARPSIGTPPGFEPLEAGVLTVSPLSDNVHKPDALAEKIRSIVGSVPGRKRSSAVVILPDHAARVAVLAFDQFPTDAKEQLALVRFRMKKTVPFDVEAAVLSYHAQSSTGKGKTELIVLVAALEIVARYEAAFRSAGLHAGQVITASIAMAELIPAIGISLLARLSGRHLSVLVANGGVLRMVRTVELAEASGDEVLGVLFPTLAYIEDEMGSPASRLLLCGFGEAGRVPDWMSELQIAVEPLRSRFGAPNGFNAGLLGYLESIGAGAKAA